MDNSEDRAPWDDPEPCPAERIQVGGATWLILFFRPGGHLDVVLIIRPPGGGACITQLGT